ncbi:DUF1542 domain-containing protein [Streptococcus pseudopneumoniae]|uniref:DUF1542 domain-containing protein n=1 Tax=Streptococcus pseudopneumoniae TaxID=257758 RepID=UPI00207ADD94|nr:DUF1542 domain-containing protein [Streptococcus pseudopneumoniae]
MFKKKNDGNGEKIFRYSIRKYHFGAASVAVAALMFFANGVQAQAPAVSSATASDVVAGSAGNSDGEPQESDGEEPEKVSQTEPSAELQSTGESNSPETKIEDASKGQETADLAPTKPEAKPAAQETSQSEREKEQDQPTSVTKTTEAKSLQGTLQALLEKLTLSSMKALHDEVESRLAAAKAVLDDPKATQAQVDEQVRAMEELTSRVNQALKPSLPKLTDLGEASSTNNKLVEPNGTATEQATGGKRRKRGGLSQATPAVDQVSSETVGNSEKTESSEKPSRQELPTYSNQGDGAYKLKDELEFIYKQLRKEGAEESKIQAAKAAADKFNEAFSKGDTISQEDFAAALVDLKKSRDLIEGVLEEKYGEETTAGGVTPQPRDGGYSDFRSANYSGRSARAARAGENYSEDFNGARESYFERTDIKGHSPYDKYTYVFFSDRRPRNEATAYIKDGYKYLNVTVKPTNKGFLWTIEINKDNHRTFPGHTEVWFTVPSGQTVKTNTVGISYRNNGGGTYAPVQDGRDLVEKLKNANIGLGDVTKGTISNSRLRRRFGPTVFPRSNLEELARGRRYDANPYERRFESRENQAISNEKLENIKRDANASLYYFQLPNSDRSYMLTFETEGNTDLGKLDYAAGLRGQDGREVFLLNQWHSRTTSEFKDDALQQIEQAKRDKNNSITSNGNLSQVEKNGETAKVNTFARRATDGINKARNIGEVENSLQQGLSDIRGVNPVGRELAKNAIDEKKRTQDGLIDNNQDLSPAEKQTAKAATKSAADKAKEAITNAADQAGVNKAKNDGLNALDKILKDLSDRINQGNSYIPGNGGNQAGSDSRGDTASQGDRPALSGDGSQGDANNQGQATTPSTPANSGDSTDQATTPSAQQRGTGNATAPESPQGLSGSSVTAPARSRRSVAFAGGAQSSQEKQVDKSVLRDLIQDLETRLKDLDGIDQSVIDAAKVILGEGQEALRNADLTEAGLREVTAKVKEALESLKGKQATKDEEETKETRKEQGHLPYGTMIGSLLALLGLLLFLIARRKKESELKKLTKELTKVLQDGDLTSVDAKVFDQAREALAQAVAFLANEKESDHTEEELIEKLKVILAQLR